MTCTTTPTTKIRHCSICKIAVIPPHGCNRCKQCNSDYLKEWRKINRLPKAPRPPKVKKIKPPVDPKLIVDCPGIWEVENRGRDTRTFNFTSLIDSSTFSFPSFREARQARQEMMQAFRQQAVFESVHRQTTGKKPAVDDEGDAPTKISSPRSEKVAE
jgi:hypothetical protein